MLISPQQARDLLAELTRACPMRLAVAALGTRGFHHHGHVFFGDTALEGHKAKNRWWFVADEVEKAGRALAGLRFEPDDLVEVPLSVRQPGEIRGDKGDDWLGPDTNWRSEIISWMGNAAFHEREPDSDWDLLHTVNPQGLPGSLTMEAFRARFGKMVRVGTYPLDHLTWTGTSWQMPREYVALMDRWQTRDNELLEQARLCRGCGNIAPRYGDWRAPTPAGYVTLLPRVFGRGLRAVRRASRRCRLHQGAAHQPARPLPVPAVRAQPRLHLGSLPRPQPGPRPALRQLQHL